MPSWSRYFPGRADQVAQARLFVASVLAGRPEAETATLVVSELSTNAVCHTASGGPGGLFAVTVRREDDRATVTVQDMGAGQVTIVTPLKREERQGRPVVAVEDVTAAARMEALARSFELAVETEHVPLGGDIDLNRPGLVVICGPRLSEMMAQAFERDPVLRWERPGQGWALRDTRTGTLFASGLDDGSGRNRDVAYLGRLPRPDGTGAFLVFTGVHPPGTLGVAALLASDIGSLWGQVGAEPFSVVVGVDFDPDTHEPVKTELLTPLYRHGQA